MKKAKIWTKAHVILVYITRHKYFSLYISFLFLNIKLVRNINLFLDTGMKSIQAYDILKVDLP